MNLNVGPMKAILKKYLRLGQPSQKFMVMAGDAYFFEEHLRNGERKVSNTIPIVGLHSVSFPDGWSFDDVTLVYRVDLLIDNDQTEAG